MIHAHATLSALWNPVLVGVLSLAAVACLWSRLYPGLIHYPVEWLARSPAFIFWGGWEDDAGGPGAGEDPVDQEGLR